MNALRNSSLLKLLIALIVIALLTGCAYFGVIGVGMTVLSIDDWANAVLGLAMENHTQQVKNYYWDIGPHMDTKEKGLSNWVKERKAEFEETFAPESTNFRYEVLDEDGNRLFGNYEGDAYLAQSSTWDQRFVGTEIQRQRLEAYESNRRYDYENNEYLNTGYSRYEVTWYFTLMPKEYQDCTYDERGYLYNEEDRVIARVENFAEVFPNLVESAETDYATDEGLYAAIVVNGVNYYPINPNDGYPSYFAFHDDYGNYYDENLNCIGHNGEQEGVIIEVTSTPRPTPRPVPQNTPIPTNTPTAKGDVKPIITKLNTVMTQEEYEALRDAVYEEVSVRGYVLKEMTVQDAYHNLYMLVMQFDAMKGEYISNAIGLGIGGVILLLVLLVLAGKRNNEGEHIAAGLGRLPWDVWFLVICILAAGVFCGIAAAVGMTEEALYYGMGQFSLNVELLRLLMQGYVAVATLCVAWLVGTIYSATAYVKVKGWWRNCLTWKLCVIVWKWCIKLLKWCWKLWIRIWNGCKKLVGGFGGALKKIPLVWKAAVVFLVVGAVEFIFFGMHSRYGEGVFLSLMWHIVRFLVCIIICLMLKRLQQGARTIADGDLDHRIDTKNLYLDFKEHAECLNRIGEGLSHNVDARLRSERMKTELITNVSHDLKTPLTSIVNYVDLLKKENLTGNAAEYVEVLDRQSARLKKLTEDLVEASKASTGSLQVNVERVSLTELVEQAVAEYAHRLQETGLQSIVRTPDEEVIVWADGKYVWRILDNLLSNVCKYAMPNTRVYLEVRTEGEYAVLSVKNMSRESLNISAEELMERFVRGDASRNTEGSGLGLSIAQSLAKLMGGEVRITIDGDLFKAEVTLPLGK